MKMLDKTVNGVVYLLTNKVTGLQCVGKSWNYENRMRQYRSSEHRRYRRQPRAVIKAIREHGWDNFTHVKIAQGIQTETALSSTEDAFIKLLKTRWPHGYNLKAGGGHGKHNVVTKAKMSAMKRGEKNPNFGKSPSLETRARMSAAKRNMSAEHRNNISASLRGRTLSPETRKKMSDAKRGEKHPMFGKRGEQHYNFGKKHSPETRKKMSASHRGNKNRKGKSHSPETKAKIRASVIAAHARKRGAVKTATTSLL